LLPPATSPLLPYTTLFRSLVVRFGVRLGRELVHRRILETADDPQILVVGARAHHWVGRWEVGLSLLDRPLKIIGVGTDITGEVRSEEHTSELQSRENLVCR